MIDLFFLLASDGLCSTYDTGDIKPLLSITFDSGPDQYSNRTPSDFHFTTTLRQTQALPEKEGQFSFLNVIPENNDNWHAGGLDHTADDKEGYMYLINIGGGRSELFESTVNNLSVGSRYEFSAYLANIYKKKLISFNDLSTIRFEVRSAMAPNQILAKLNIDDIPVYDQLTWSKYGLSFVASTSSVILFMTLNFGNIFGNIFGNDIAIDDIELRVCSNNHSVYFPTGQCTLVFSA